MRRGFTLIETLIVLIISAMLLSLSLYMAQNLKLDSFQDYFFWKQFQSQFESAENNARQQHSEIDVKLVPHRPIVITSVGYRIKRQMIKTPKNLTVLRPDQIKIKSDGHLDPKTIVWIRNGRTRLNQRFQLGWGMYTFDHKTS